MNTRRTTRTQAASVGTLLVMLLSACSTAVDPGDAGIVSGLSGLITKDAANGVYYIVVDGAPSGVYPRLWPSNLPERLKEDGLRIRFGGILVPCPPNANCIAEEIVLMTVLPL